MGAWGFGIFQSDSDLDYVGNISVDASKLAGDDNMELWYPENREQVVAKLNDDLFHTLLKQYHSTKDYYSTVYLGAISMQLGVKIADKDMRTIKSSIMKIGMFDEGKAQMLKAIKEYNNDGEPWNFNSPGLLETASLKAAEEDHGNIGAKAMRGDESGDGKRAAASEMGEEPAGKENAKPTQAPKLTGKDKLGDKKKVQAWFGS